MSKCLFAPLCHSKWTLPPSSTNTLILTRLSLSVCHYSGVWSNVVINLADLMHGLVSAPYRTCDSITIHSSCQLRNVFTVAEAPSASQGTLPMSHNFPYAVLSTTRTVELSCATIADADAAARGGSAQPAVLIGKMQLSVRQPSGSATKGRASAGRSASAAGHARPGQQQQQPHTARRASNRRTPQQQQHGRLPRSESAAGRSRQARRCSSPSSPLPPLPSYTLTSISLTPSTPSLQLCRLP